MKNKINDNYSLKYKQDANDICEEINKYLPNIEKWQLDQSVILGEDKKIIMRAVKDTKNEKIGNMITIYFKGNNPSICSLAIFKNSLSLTKMFLQPEKEVTEFTSISLKDNTLNRECFYKINDETLEYQETCNLDNNTNEVITNVTDLNEESSISLKDVLENFKNKSVKNKSRQRKR